ncbi:amidohydrolase family protein [Marinicella meishanensis]|uniref:amidohydrolase family protein n=1 Tax=Marinicella meishanensis TaxID=2873263 RepID=UPI001CC0BAE2|nr:amidohydrolase family protein [Marinicella sp. NBU2979]
MKSFKNSMVTLIMFAQVFFVAYANNENGQITLANVQYLDTTSMKFRHVKFLNLDSGIIHSMGEKRLHGSELLDLSGKFLTPGLIDTHVHLLMSESDTKRVPEALNDVLLDGVTSVRDMAGNNQLISDIQAEGPDIYQSFLVAGKSFFTDPRVKFASMPYQPGEAPWQYQVGSDFNHKDFELKLKNSHTHGIKLYANIAPLHIKKITEVARNHQIPIYSHATVFPSKPSDLVNAGVETLVHAALLPWEGSRKVKEQYHSRPRFPNEHVDPRAPQFEELFADMAQKGIFLEPTISLFHSENNSQPTRITQWVCESLRLAEEKKVPLVIGTDNMINHDQRTSNIHKEMSVLVNTCGLNATTVLRGATLNGAISLGLENSLGKISVGYKADMVVFDENPLKDISQTKSIHVVIKEGRILKLSDSKI